ncbi:MAG: radical SAM protein [Bryobacterales bacterium]|nr:radical SAM protein [Bryobacterales bacterium]
MKIELTPNRTAAAPLKTTVHHMLEGVLAWPVTRRVLGAITRLDDKETCLFERMCENYNRPALARSDQVKWRLPGFLIDYGLRRAKLDKNLMTEKLFHHQPTVRALALACRSIAKYGLSAPQRFAAPLMVVWNLTQACNLRCRHCYQDATPKPAPDELTPTEKLEVIGRMGAAGVPFLAIAGGEPLVSKDLWPVLDEARKRRIHVSLATNGTLLTKENVARLVEAGVKYVEVSVDSAIPEEHDSFRGQPGAWQRSIEGIRTCVASGMRTGMATCLTRCTVAKVDEIVEFAISLGCRTFSHFNFIPVGRGRGIAKADLTPSQREWLMRKLVDHLQDGRINIISTAPQFGHACVAYAPSDGLFATGHAGSGKGAQTMVLAKYVGGCGAGRCYCGIQPNGDVTPCVYIPALKVGNLRRHSFADVWESALFGILSDRSRRQDHCARCTGRAYCGGCRARAFAYLDDIQAGDPGCVQNRGLWDDLVISEGLVSMEVLTRSGSIDPADKRRQQSAVSQIGHDSQRQAVSHASRKADHY